MSDTCLNCGSDIYKFEEASTGFPGVTEYSCGRVHVEDHGGDVNVFTSEACDVIRGLREELRRERLVANSLMDERDRAEKWADKLAYTIAPMEVIGEHSTANCPWENAYELGIDNSKAMDAERDRIADWHQAMAKDLEGVRGYLCQEHKDAAEAIRNNEHRSKA